MNTIKITSPHGDQIELQEIDFMHFISPAKDDEDDGIWHHQEELINHIMNAGMSAAHIWGYSFPINETLTPVIDALLRYLRIADGDFDEIDTDNADDPVG